MPLDEIFASCAEVEATRFQSECYETEFSGFYHWALVDRDATIANRQLPTVAELLAAELVGKAVIIRDTFGSLPRPSETSGREIGGRPAQVISRTHTATLTEPQFIGNEDFWNKTARRSNKDLYIFTEKRIIPVVNQSLTINHGIDYVEGIGTQENWGSIVISWKNIDVPVTQPFSVEDRQSLSVFPVLDFGSITENVAGDATITGSTVTTPVGSLIDLTATITGATTYSSTGTLPAGLTGTSTATGYVITGTPTAAGTSKITVTGANAYGISGGQEIVISVTPA
jgi:hypothetical protein